jgi:hypothetical protein
MELWSSVVEFYETDPALTLVVGIGSIVGFLLTLSGVTYGCYACVKELAKRGASYNVRKAEKQHGNEGWAYESFVLKEMYPELYPKQQDSVTFEEEPRHSNIRTKVMVTNEDGHIPPYTLRTRARDGSISSYTTYYNINIGCETEL